MFGLVLTYLTYALPLANREKLTTTCLLHEKCVQLSWLRLAGFCLLQRKKEAITRNKQLD